MVAGRPPRTAVSPCPVEGPGAPAAGAGRLWEALLASSRSGRRLPAGEDVAVRILAREMASLDADIEELDSLVADSLAGDEVYECLLTVPGIGPKTAAALVTSIDISAFRGTTSSRATAAWRRPTGAPGAASGRRRRSAAGTGSSRTCSYSAATPSSARTTGSGGTTGSAGRGG